MRFVVGRGCTQSQVGLWLDAGGWVWLLVVTTQEQINHINNQEAVTSREGTASACCSVLPGLLFSCCGHRAEHRRHTQVHMRMAQVHVSVTS